MLAALLALPATVTASPAVAAQSRALHHLMHWVKATQAENRADGRHVMVYHNGHRHCKAPAKACRWRLAALWHRKYVHAVKQKPRLVYGSSTVAIGARLAARRGWVGSQFNCLYALWNRESGWNPLAHNPSSGAHGIPQALPGSKMGLGWYSNVYVQIRWGLGYISARYGTPCVADYFQQSHGWY